MPSNLPEEECEAWLALLRAPRLSTARLRLAVRHAGGVREAAQAPQSLWRDIGAPHVPHALRRIDAATRVRDRAWLDHPQHHLLVFDSTDFPPQLERSPDPPAALFVRGDPGTMLLPQLAVVGARGATAGGLALARDFARALAHRGIAITSGLADGADGAAHAGALAAGQATVAVCGTGLDEVYPAKHEALAARIAENGAVVSEYPLGTRAQQWQFPHRNRIIAGLSLGVLVVEASVRSGSLITARLAADAGREVFAIPGSIHNPLARGCHRLIRQGAKLVESAEDVLEELVPLARQQGIELAALLAQDEAVATTVSQRRARTTHDPARRALLAALGHDPVSVDELCARSGLTAPAVSSMLLLLELDGVVAAQAGARYSRVRGP